MTVENWGQQVDANQMGLNHVGKTTFSSVVFFSICLAPVWKVSATDQSGQEIQQKLQVTCSNVF